MSIIQLKKRPLKRDETRLRDDRLFIVACDDTYAPKQYFEFFEIPRVHIHVIPSEEGENSAGHVLEHLLACERGDDDELWLLLDTDHYASGRHVKNFISAIKRARRHGVQVALSKPCFELWLLLHHVDETEVAELADASEVGRKIRQVLGEYNKKSLKPGHFPLELVPSAFKRAARLDVSIGGGEIPAGNNSRVYLLWQSIIDKAHPLQLPDVLAGLKS